MSNDLAKRPGPTATGPVEDAASRLKRELMADTLGRMLGKDDVKSTAPGNPRVLLALANHARSPGWDHAKVLQRQMFEAASGSSLEMKFAYYAEDDDRGMRRCLMGKRWITDPNDMSALMDRVECNCGCFVNIRNVLEGAVKENQDRPMRAVVIVGDAFHDSEDGLVEAALAANQLRREGTRVFLIQQGADPHTTRKLQYLARVSGATYFRFDPKRQQQAIAEMLKAVSTYAAGGEEAVKVSGGQAATLLLQYLKQQPMPILEEQREHVRVSPKERR
jgi:hypothetical protein